MQLAVYRMTHRETEADKEHRKRPVMLNPSKPSPAESPAGGTLEHRMPACSLLPTNKNSTDHKLLEICPISKIPVCLQSSQEMALQGCVTLSKRLAHSGIQFHGPLDVSISFCERQNKGMGAELCKVPAVRKPLTLTVSRQQKRSKGLQGGRNGREG